MPDPPVAVPDLWANLPGTPWAMADKVPRFVRGSLSEEAWEVMGLLFVAFVETRFEAAEVDRLGT
jgi:hypothetical protein